LWAKVKSWTQLRHVGGNHDVAQDLIAWALGKGYKVTDHTPEHEAS
jgi:hypothetical protein